MEYHVEVCSNCCTVFSWTKHPLVGPTGAIQCNVCGEVGTNITLGEETEPKILVGVIDSMISARIEFVSSVRKFMK